MSDIAAEGAFAAPRSRRVKDLIAVNFGNTLEWFDWTIYTIFAPYFALQFFPSADKSAALLAALAVFAAGFLTRPLGGFLFGLYADRVGRVTFIGTTLFRANLHLPSNVPTGTFLIDVYLVRDGKIVDAQNMPLVISKVGFGADIYKYANARSIAQRFAYGVTAVLAALLTGWLAHLVFRKR